MKLLRYYSMDTDHPAFAKSPWTLRYFVFKKYHRWEIAMGNASSKGPNQVSTGQPAAKKRRRTSSSSTSEQAATEEEREMEQDSVLRQVSEGGVNVTRLC
eukprot:COSAG02_NODE_129_length_34796_cov_26.576015_27_plen_100_part_00